MLPSVSQINNSDRVSVSYITRRSQNVSPINISGQILSDIQEHSRKPKTKRKSIIKSDLSAEAHEKEVKEQRSPSQVVKFSRNEKLKYQKNEDFLKTCRNTFMPSDILKKQRRNSLVDS